MGLRGDMDGGGTTIRHGIAGAIAPFALAYFFSYFLRSINALIATDLTTELGLGATALGLLTASYFFASTFSQLPLGILFDRYGVQPVQGWALFVAGLGALLFSIGETVAALALARTLIGAGVAGCLMSAFAMMRMVLPADRLPLGFGLFLSAGGLGALAATLPAELILARMHWRSIFAASALALFAIAFAILRSSRPPGPTHPTTGFGDLLRGVLEIYRDALFWRLAPVTIACFGVGSAIQGLWAGPWLRDVAGFDRPAIASHLLALTVALTLGSTLAGLLNDRLRHRASSTLTIVRWSTFVCLVSQLALLNASAAWAWALWGVFGLTYNVVSLNYSILTQAAAPERAGRINSALNVLVAGGSFLAQWAIGAIIDVWSPSTSGSYPPEAYRTAFGIMLILQAATFAWFMRPLPRRSDRTSI